MDVLSYALSKKYTNEQINEQKLKVAKLEQELNNHKSVMSQVNINQEATQKASGYGIVSLPKNAANGQVSVSIFGNTYRQIIQNGNFSSGTTKWNTYNATPLTVEDNEAIFTATARYGYLYQELGAEGIKNGDKIYITALVKADNNQVRLSLLYKSGYSAGHKSHSGSGNYERLSTIATIPEIPAQYYPQICVQDYRTSEWTEIRVKEFLAVNLTQLFGAGKEPVLAECDKMFSYISYGTKSTINARVKSIGRNLFPDTVVQEMAKATSTRGTVSFENNKIKFVSTENDAFINNFTLNRQLPVNFRKYAIRIPAGTVYYKRTIERLTAGNTNEYVFYYDVNYNYISHVSISQASNGIKTNILTVPSNAYYAVFRVGATVAGQTVYYSNFMLSKENIDYESYKETVIYTPADIVLRSLPNNTKDEISITEKKFIKKISDEYIIQNSDIQSLYTSLTNVDLVLLNKSPVLNGYIKYDTDNRDATDIYWYGFSPLKNANIDDNSNIWKYYKNVNNLALIVPKGYYANLAAAQADLAGTKLIYQLAEPVEIPIEVYGTLLSYPSGTVYLERILPDAGIYSEKGFTIQYPANIKIKRVDILIKYDYDTGTEIVLDPAQAVISTDKYSFTHPSLQAGDMVFVDFEYDLESTEGEMEIEYYDSRVVKQDKAVPNKYYKIDFEVNNGVPSLKATEV